MTHTVTYTVHGMSCGHCTEAVTRAVLAVAGVTRVAVDLDDKLVTVTGESLDDATLRTAIEAAGYEAAP